MNTINITNKGTDAVLDVTRAMNRGGCEDFEIRFEKGVYHFYPDYAGEEYFFVTNNDHSLKRVLFLIKNKKNVVIDGNGSEFIFHGRLLPFIIEESENVIIKNISIDYARPFYSQGEILGQENGKLVIRIDKEHFPYKVENGKIIFYGEEGNAYWESDYIQNMVCFDPVTGAPSFGTKDFFAYRSEAPFIVKEKDADTIEITADFRQQYPAGHYMIFKHDHRYASAFSMVNSKNVKVENVNVYHAGAMGVIAQRCENVTLSHYNVLARGHRLVSAFVDATHFDDCLGNITLENCTLESQLDDATNIHGMYTEVEKILSEDLVLAKIGHFQQQGTNIYQAGDKIAFLNDQYIDYVQEAVVREVSQVNQCFILIRLQKALSDEVKEKFLIKNLTTAGPKVLIRNCRVGKNRARGFLLRSENETVVENCEFYTSGAAISINSKLSNWYESGVCRNLILKNNKFINCCYCTWGRAVIDIDGLTVGEKTAHSNITIENNVFVTSEKCVMKAGGVSDLKIRNNEIRYSSAYPGFRDSAQTWDIDGCRGVEIS